MTKRHIALSLASLILFLPAAVHAKRPKAQPKIVLVADRPLAPEDKHHLLHDTFTIVKTVREVPQPVQKLLITDTKNPLNGMANAGQDFNRIDVINGELPMRRLVLAAVNAHYCLVYSEQGGFGYGQRVTLFHLQNGRATMRWDAGRGGYFLSTEESLLTFPELRAALKHRKG